MEMPVKLVVHVLHVAAVVPPLLVATGIRRRVAHARRTITEPPQLQQQLL
jgi:hypothetical protein